jgi:anti-sigma regulatory factor (Ser/Thr protein kinase)
MDEIALTLPADEAFHSVAHLVLGGLAVRLDLTVEALEELALAVETLLQRSEDAYADEISVRVRIGDETIQTVVGPFLEDLRSELEGDSGAALDLKRILRAVCDRVEISEDGGGQWVELTKRVQLARGEGK